MAKTKFAVAVALAELEGKSARKGRQAIAIGLSESGKKGAKTPPHPKKK